MQVLSVAREYIIWHYTTAYVDLVHVWWNYLWFVNHIFSFPDVVRSWFAPFKRLQEGKVNIMLHPSDFLANIVVNIIMRLVGTILRTALIAIALIGFSFVFVLGLLLLSLWTILAILVGHFLITGAQSLFA